MWRMVCRIVGCKKRKQNSRIELVISDVAWRMEIGKWMGMFSIYFKVRVKRIIDILYMSAGNKIEGPNMKSSWQGHLIYLRLL